MKESLRGLAVKARQAKPLISDLPHGARDSHLDLRPSNAVLDLSESSRAIMDDLQVRLRYMKSDVDDWTKVEDKALRKKIQNRLAKRKSRKDGGKARTTKKHAPAGPPEDGSQTTGLENIVRSPSDSSSTSITRLGPDTPDTSLASVDDYVQSLISMLGLSEHRFLRLTQYSLMRALVQNASILALDFLFLLDDEALSPWTLSNPHPALTPSDLNPTTIQLCTPHHPYLDIIASPAFRDNVLLACLEDEVAEQLCFEMHLGSFTVWGSQPWNAMAWEVSQDFATSWWWLLDEASIRATNFWRGERGEPALVLPYSGGCVIEELF